MTKSCENPPGPWDRTRPINFGLETKDNECKVALDSFMSRRKFEPLR